MQNIWDKYPVVLKTKPGGPGYPTYGGSIVTVKFASPLQNIRLTAEENDVIKKSSNIMNEAYTRKNHPDSAYAPNGSLDSSGVRPTATSPRIHTGRSRNFCTVLLQCGICSYRDETGEIIVSNPKSEDKLTWIVAIIHYYYFYYYSYLRHDGDVGSGEPCSENSR